MARTEDVMGETIYQDKVESKRKEKLSQVVNVYELQKAVAHPASLILDDFFSVGNLFCSGKEDQEHLTLA